MFEPAPPRQVETVVMYTFTYHGTDIYLKTTRRYIKYKSMKALCDTATRFFDMLEWRMEALPDLTKEQEQDGLIDAFRYIKYERKKNALIHLRMAVKLLHWHKLSIEKLWDPSKPENHERIMEIFYRDI